MCVLKRRITKYTRTCSKNFILFNEVFDLGNLVVYLIKGSKDTEKNRICFQKLDIDLFDKNNDYFVIKLLPDPVIGNVKMLSEAGLIKFKIKLGKPSNKR